ncbi:MarR family winged helix-turn-helix transcriptional regulator [Deinococcus misasensis]|uniref:MarR family winged helix-turn-helix transcriptional regulator n=1 Tax=Deinococcus misasensis TaxID=392413 RepID=UPI0006913312|nr:MarR family winged helix-turn-helix transcriptional regulator [Deinococcus misasensis]
MTSPLPSDDFKALDQTLLQLLTALEVVLIARPLATVLGEEEEVTGAQLRTLRFLDSVEFALVGDIAAGLGISYPAATKAVDRLCDRGLAERYRDAMDARRIQVSLTPRGKSVLQEVQSERTRYLQGIFQQMPQTPADFNVQLLALLREITRDPDVLEAIRRQSGQL